MFLEPMENDRPDMSPHAITTVLAILLCLAIVMFILTREEPAKVSEQAEPSVSKSDDDEWQIVPSRFEKSTEKTMQSP
jgi:hypothetical protein